MKGDGTVTYEDPFSAASAVQWFNDKEFKGTATTPALVRHPNSPETTPQVRPPFPCRPATRLQSQVQTILHAADNHESASPRRGTSGMLCFLDA